MNKPQRSPSEVLKLNPKIDSFIQHGVGEEAEAIPERSKLEARNDADKREARVKSRVAKSSNKARKTTVAKPQIDPLMQATLSKATIQKTVRFNPQLITRWEQHAQSVRESGQHPAPFQQVQNEALALWLKENAKSNVGKTHGAASQSGSE